MILIKIYKKIRREMYKQLSKICLKRATVNYFGLELNVPIVDGVGAGFLFPDDKWMSDCLTVFLKLKKGTVVDIGVNIGLYMVKLKAIDSSREYIGFEPNAVCNYYTQELIRENNFQKVRVLPFALSDKKELRTFYIRRKADKMGSLNDYARFGDADKVSFDLFTFPGDDFFELLNVDSVCVFKIDVEGAEFEVLRGLGSTIKKHKPYLFCEIWQLPETSHPTYNEKLERLKSIRELMKNLDYNILGVSAKDASDVSVLETLESFDGTHRRDYIFVHRTEMDDLRSKLVEI